MIVGTEFQGGTSDSLPRSDSHDKPIVWGVVGWVAATLILTAGLFALIAFMHGGWVWPDTSTDPDWIRTVVLSTLPTAGVLAGGAAVALTVRRQKTAEANLRISGEQLGHVRSEAAAATRRTQDQVDRELVAGLRERFSIAATQLGDAAEPIQLAGVYSLAALADDWLNRGNRAETQVCIRLLCAFLKSNRLPPIRAAIFEVIREKLLAPNAVWAGFRFDLEGIEINESDRVRLRGIVVGPGTVLSFDHAVMTGGQLNFENITVNGGRLDFTRADLREGRLQFGGAWFTSGDVTFKSARFGSAMKVGLRPRILRKGVVSLVNARGAVPVLVVPPSEAVIAARKARKSERREAATE